MPPCHPVSPSGCLVKPSPSPPSSVLFSSSPCFSPSHPLCYLYRDNRPSGRVNSLFSYPSLSIAIRRFCCHPRRSSENAFSTPLHLPLHLQNYRRQHPTVALSQEPLPLSLFSSPAKMTMDPPIVFEETNRFIPARNETPLQRSERDTNVLPTSNLPALPGTVASSSLHSPAIQQTKVNPPHTNKKQLINNGKVAIPRQRANHTPRYSRRVPRACQSCRQRKTKCSGDTPVCRQCKELRITCDYPVSWRERTNRFVLYCFVAWYLN